ncbi:hypothetical protein CONCODRAFT_6169 [Conidiobolus coronatus NRRL 28638]|uniref:Uncharacterized protein n=1 Tax=Conidiobolus coronatus (strain ATCC 28846 / CBS 209.66 / NRRL 28638) TaxID=796925 RepID=A0A137P801_CONC2|nr:hypothetical protein CONCODRAFT_6169 [Conidiobolus coronatus NRRL 28638]|eukprot:KXN71147.1 hypothetical protein CONCODRAFT_6169 [Conidiobolus coronatus NRRL 28638]
MVKKKLMNKQRSAEEARGAHNPEVGGSKPLAAKSFCLFIIIIMLNNLINLSLIDVIGILH